MCVLQLLNTVHPVHKNPASCRIFYFNKLDNVLDVTLCKHLHRKGRHGEHNVKFSDNNGYLVKTLAYCVTGS